MFFFPFKANLTLNRIPFITIIICVLCILVYVNQVRSNEAVLKSATDFCLNINNIEFEVSLKKITDEDIITGCVHVLFALHSAQGDPAYVQFLAKNADAFHDMGRESGEQLIINSIKDEYFKFNLKAPKLLTTDLQYEPQSYNPARMLTSSFAHADIYHLLGNLAFFFAFAASIEIVIGWLKYILVFTLLSFFESLGYSLSLMGGGEALLPTIGLSGVVMGMIGMFAYLMPFIGIRCIVFFIVILKIVVIPAWLLALVYAGLDIYALYYGDANTQVNLVAHISGAFSGFILAFLFFRKEKENIKTLF